MKILPSVFLLLFSIVSIAAAEVIDVIIKGVDDGRKTSKQQDYKEAVMNAKLQAIEQAGASIESITQVVNFQLKYDTVESKSKAILLPGFQIIDIGYVADGTYQVVLIAKIQTGGKETRANEITRDGRFVAYDNGTVLDTLTNLMWAGKDSGPDIKLNWWDAKRHCANYRGGGYADWRLPTLNELEGLYESSKSYQVMQIITAINAPVNSRFYLTELIQLSDCCPWAADTRGYEVSAFGFNGSGNRFWYDQSNVYARFKKAILPVRSAK